MKRLLAFLFLFIYLLNQAVYALPALNRTEMTYEFKKKCKFGRKDKLFKRDVSDKTNLSETQEQSDMKVISFCSADIHTHQESNFLFIMPEAINHHPVYMAAYYSCNSNIHSPPPCFN